MCRLTVCTCAHASYILQHYVIAHFLLHLKRIRFQGTHTLSLELLCITFTVFVVLLSYSN